MKRILKFSVKTIFFICILIVSLTVDIEAEETGKFTLYSTVYDYGQRIDEIILEYPFEINAEDLDLDTFKVTTENTINEHVVDNGERKIINFQVEPGLNSSKIILYLDSSLESEYSKTMLWDEEAFSNIPLEISYRIEQTKAIAENPIIENFKYVGIVNREVDDFASDDYQGIPYRYYEPELVGESHPLIIWLHGAGEGGKNNSIQITANRGAVAFTELGNQFLLDFPYVLAPQSPDYWMPELQLGELVLKGHNRNTELIDLIEDFISRHENIDTSRIYIGGTSMGGYQTWELVATRPDLFAAAFPSSTAYKVPKNVLDKVADIPFWITHAIDDDVIPYEYSRDAYQYLIENGSENVVFSSWKQVNYNWESYSPHASEIYVLQDKVRNNNGESFIEWLANQ